MPADNRYLMQRHQSWYVKVTIPPSLYPLFNGRQHIVRSLKTRDLTKARELRHAAVAKIKEMLQQARVDGTVAIAEQFRQRKKVLKANKQSPNSKEISKFDTFIRAVEKKEGLLAAQEAAGRGLDNFTDLDAHEAEWFKLMKFNNKTEIRYRQSVRMLRKWMKDQNMEACCEVVDAKVALGFRKHLDDEGTHRKTGNALLSALRSRWTYLIEKEVIPPLNPWRDVKMPRPRTGEAPPRRPFDNEELIKLFSGPVEQNLFNVMTLLALTGLRLGEVYGFRVKDYKDGFFLVLKGKNKNAIRRITCPDILNDKMPTLIGERQEDDFILFEPPPPKGHQRGHYASKDFTKYRRSVGVSGKDTTLHSLRHVFSTLADEAGHQRHHIQKIIGHGSGTKSATDIYTHSFDAIYATMIRDVTARLPEKVRDMIIKRFGPQDAVIRKKGRRPKQRPENVS